MNQFKMIFNILRSVKNTAANNKKMSKEQANHANTIIRNHVIWSMGAGLIPVLIADIFAISALQLDMIRQLCKVYDVDFKETQGKAIVTSLTTSTLARIGASSLAKMIPVVGSIIGGVTVSVFAGASTYALGEVFKKHFESGGTILDFDPDRLRKYYKEKFEKGKSIAKEYKQEYDATDSAEAPVEEKPTTTVEVETNAATEQVVEQVTQNEQTVVSEAPAESPKDIISRIKELSELKDAGALTQEEFEQMKRKLIEEF